MLLGEKNNKKRFPMLKDGHHVFGGEPYKAGDEEDTLLVQFLLLLPISAYLTGITHILKFVFVNEMGS